MSQQHTVWSRCFVGGRGANGEGQDLQSMFKGTRSQCETFVRRRARMGLPTHFCLISSLGYERACRRYLP